MQQEIKQETSFMNPEEFRDKVYEIIFRDDYVGDFEITSEKLKDLFKLSVYKAFFLFNPGAEFLLSAEILRHELIGDCVKAARMFIYDNVLRIHQKYYTEEKDLNPKQDNKEKGFDLKPEAKVICEEFESFIKIRKLENCDIFMNTMKVIDSLHSKIVTFWSKDIASELNTIHSGFSKKFWGGILVRKVGYNSSTIKLDYCKDDRGDKLLLLKYTDKEQKEQVIKLTKKPLLESYARFYTLDKGLCEFLYKSKLVDNYAKLDDMIMKFRATASSVYGFFGTLGTFAKDQGSDFHKTSIYISSGLIRSYLKASRILMKFISIRYLYEPRIVETNDMVLDYFEGLIDKTQNDNRSTDHCALCDLIKKQYEFFSLVEDFVKGLYYALIEVNDHNKQQKEISEKFHNIAYDSFEFKKIIDSFQSGFKKIKSSNLDEDKKNESKTIVSGFKKIKSNLEKDKKSESKTT